MQYKPSVHNWTNLMVFERRVIFFLKKEKTKSSMAQQGSYLSLLPIRHQIVSGRVGNDLPPTRKRQQDIHIGFHSVPQPASSGLIQHTYIESIRHYTQPQESKMVTRKHCLPGTQDEHQPGLIFWEKKFLLGTPLLKWLTTDRAILNTGVCVCAHACALSRLPRKALSFTEDLPRARCWTGPFISSNSCNLTITAWDKHRDSPF